jgi:hypothetical protein
MASVRIQSLPAGVLTEVLIGAHFTRLMAPHALLLHVATVAQVHRDWRAVVRGSPLYGCSACAGLSRPWLLTLLTKALRRALQCGMLTFQDTRMSGSLDEHYSPTDVDWFLDWEILRNDRQNDSEPRPDRVIGAAGAEILAATLSAGSPLVFHGSESLRLTYSVYSPPDKWCSENTLTDLRLRGCGLNAESLAQLVPALGHSQGATDRGLRGLT